MNALDIVLTLGLAAIVELPIAFYNRWRILKEVREGEARMNARLDDLKPAAGAMRGGHDPAAMAELRIQRQEEKRLAALATEVEVKSFLAERLGPERVQLVADFLGDETMQGIYQAGKKWKFLLDPLLKRLPDKMTQPSDEVPFATQ